MLLSLNPKICVALASLPGPVLAAASTILFGIIALSGVQMLKDVEWDEMNLAVAATSFIIALGSAALPPSLLQTLSPVWRGLVTQPMLVGVVLLVALNLLINGFARPRLNKGKGRQGEASPVRPASRAML